MAGLRASLEAGADVIVNTDADNQYCAADIPCARRPDPRGKGRHRHRFSPHKDDPALFSSQESSPGTRDRRCSRCERHGHRGCTVRVPRREPRGGNAPARLQRLHLHAGDDHPGGSEEHGRGIRARPGERRDPPVTPREKHSRAMSRNRSSRCSASSWSTGPFRFFMAIGGTLFAAGVLVGLRFLAFLVFGGAGGHVQSLILASILLGIGFQTMLTAFLADLLAVNRTLLEEIEYQALRNADRQGKGPGVKGPS